VGSTRTMVRYKVGAYPTSETDGMEVYFDVLSNTSHTSLTPGVTYYYSAWGESGVAGYSAAYTSVMATTTSSDDDDGAPGAMDTPVLWFQAPDYSGFPPTVQLFVNAFADSLEIPRGTFWMLGALIGCVFVGGVSLALTKKVQVALIVLGIAMIIASVIKLLPLWMIVFAIMFFLGAAKMTPAGGFGR